MIHIPLLLRFLDFRRKNKKPAFSAESAGLLEGAGGAYRGRTDDLLHAMQAL